jgi:hypothetical protein
MHRIFFSWEMGLELLKSGRKLRGGRTPLGLEGTAAGGETLAGAVL